MTNDELKADMEQYRSMLFRLAYSCTGDLSCCDDIVQETFVKLYLRAKPFPDQEGKKAWLIRITINLSKNHVKSGYFRQRAELPDNISISDERDDAVALEEALKQLKPEYRGVIHLHYYMGYTAAEIGDILHISTTAVTTRLQRGREKLKKYLADEKENVYE
ncbi:MAG: RNA polymerase sigma factor [Oscillospiraceae bacterium]|nr:RNA polymerase sigma factor [Oscillospiraceae bacterium]